MKHRGYSIVKAIHPTAVNPARETYDIMDGDVVRQPNVSTVDFCKRIIDWMIEWNHWPEKSTQ